MFGRHFALFLAFFALFLRPFALFLAFFARFLRRFALFLGFFARFVIFEAFAKFMAFFAGGFPVDDFFEFGLVVFPSQLARELCDRGAAGRRFSRFGGPGRGARAAREHGCSEGCENSERAQAPAALEHGNDFGANWPPLERSGAMAATRAAALLPQQLQQPGFVEHGHAQALRLLEL